MLILLQPAVRGTINVLAHAHQAGVKKVVITSSFAAMKCVTSLERYFTYTDLDYSNNLLGGAFRDHTYTAEGQPLIAVACAKY